MKKFLGLFCLGFVLFSSSVYAKEDPKMPLINEAKKDVGEITPQALKEIFEKEEKVVILDVRETEQRTEGYIYDDFTPVKTVSITRGNLEWEVPDMIEDKNILIVTYCRNGGRGALAAQTLKKLGYKNVKNLQGGLKDWAASGYPIKTGLGVVKAVK